MRSRLMGHPSSILPTTGPFAKDVGRGNHLQSITDDAIATMTQDRYVPPFEIVST